MEANKLRVALKASFFTSITQGLRMLMGLAIVKLIAVFLGPSGFAELGNYWSLMNFLFAFAVGGCGPLLISLASRKKSALGTNRLINQATRYSNNFTVLFFLLALFYYFSDLAFLGSIEGGAEFLLILPFAYYLFSQGTITNSQIIASGRLSDITVITAVSAVIVILSTFGLVSFYGSLGALAALLLLNLAPSFLTTLKFGRFGHPLKFKVSRLTHRPYCNFRKFSLMAVVGAAAFPTAEILIRTSMIGTYGLEAAGIWSATIRLSSVFTSFGLAFLGTHYLTKISNMPPAHLGKFVAKYFISINLIYIFLNFFIHFVSDFVVLSAFDESFMPVKDYLWMQILSDQLRVSAYLMTMFTVVYSSARYYLLSEVAQWGGFSAATFIVLDNGYSLDSVFMVSILFFSVYLGSCMIGFTLMLKKVDTPKI